MSNNIFSSLSEKFKSVMKTQGRQYMKVNLSDLVIDLPVDESHVLELMESIGRVGLTEPPTIWLNGMRIINGFHRIVACQRLGITELECFVDDKSEDAFWDARIIAAKPHAKISDERLGAWILESWQLTPWYKPVDPASVQIEYDKLGTKLGAELTDQDLIRYSAGAVVWGADFSLPRSKQKRLSEQEAWFVEKANRWGVSKYDIQTKLLTALGFDLDWYILNQIKAEVTLPQAVAISKQTQPVPSYKVSGTKKAEWVESKLSGATSKPLVAYVKERKQEAKSIKDKQEVWQQTPAGQAELRKQKLAEIDRKLDNVFDAIQNLDLKEYPEILRRLTSLIAFIDEKIIEVFPEHAEGGKTDPVVLDNAALQKQIKKQQRKIESLERALDSKQGIVKRLPNVTALSSVEVEAMN